MPCLRRLKALARYANNRLPSVPGWLGDAVTPGCAPRRRSRSAGALLALLLLCTAFQAQALSVREVVIRAGENVSVDVDAVVVRTRMRAGMDFSRETINQDVRDLLATGRFADVAAVIEPLTDDEVRLIYLVEPKPILAEQVVVIGADKNKESDIRDWAGLRVGDAVSEIDAQAAAANVRRELIDKRYNHARVKAQLLPSDHAADAVVVHMLVNEEQRVRLQRVDFEGNTAFSDAELRRAMRLPRMWNPINWFRRRPYLPGEINLAADGVRERYRNEGYLDVRVADAVSRAVTPAKRRATITIDEGTRYTVGDILIEGLNVLDAAELRESLMLETGDLAAMNAIREAARNIGAAYAARGFRGTVVTPDLLPDAEEPVVTIRFRVREGRKTDVRMIHVRGNFKTRDKVIRRELALAPGDRYDEARIRRSENRLMQLGFFSQVDSYAEDVVPGVSDLVFEVEEKQTGEFMIGAGFSSIDKVMGFAEISQGNFDIWNWPTFTGGGQKLNLRAQFGSESRDYRLTFVEPWFLDRRLSLGLEGYMQQNRYSDYEVERVGGALTLGVPLRGRSRLETGYRFESSDVIRVADTNLYIGADGRDFYFNQEGRRDKSMLSLAVSQDTRDSFFVPTRGRTMRLGAHYAGGVAGGDTDTYGFDGRAELYFPLWWRHVIGFQIRADVIDSHGDNADVPLSDRLFAGGQGSIRGFRYRDVGPKAVRVADDGSTRRRAQGGQTRGLATAEYTIPLVDGVRLAGFVDAGNVWLEPYEVRLDKLAIGAGIGLRLDLPGFPIRFDYAWPLQLDDPETRTRRFSFRVGYGF